MSDIDSGKWLEAMKSKMDSMSLNQVWTLVDRSKVLNPFSVSGVYKYKIVVDRKVTTFEAKLVTKGYTQRLGVDFEETFSPVAMAKSIRIMLAIAAWYDYEIWQMDVKMAFLNSFVDKEIYMDQPEGFTIVGEEQKVCHLQRSIYSLKQASRSWNIHFDEVIRCYDFVKNNFDPCVYQKYTRPDVAYALSVTSRYQACAEEAHWIAVRIILKYLGRTKDMFLVYDGGELILEGYSNTSFQSDDDDAKSQSGLVFKLNGGVMAWKSSKKDTTTDSTMEVEYIAASEAAKETIWMKNYI
ncbi:UNVERIFIED_CONTAM: Retrovirus-related Pol polyprotein from transposon TNT 1-94 [Sesamum radiatum]|uniref:Retrovirus-related Pol polyprotein from transposon TNT 1-94 n=1 Tax=Sesamum radiatum TaxID=300843 RepID=A0AAW2Q0J7_SESRA